MLSKISYRPFEGRRRVVLIREADTLEPESQNALLKSLEEPPPGTMFILTSAVPGVLLPTVRSRCMRLRFGRLTAAEVAAGLTRDHEYSEVEARQAAPLADGSLGQALALIDNDLSMFRDLAMGLLRNSANRADAQSRVQAAAPLHTGKKERSREDVAIILRLMASMLRDLEAINAGADRAVLANPLLSGDLEGLARAYSGDRARTAFGAVDRALDGARAQRRHESGHRVAGRADVMGLPKIALTVGDPAGIGPEIVEKAAADPSVRAVCEPIVFAPPSDRNIRPGEVSAVAGRAAYNTLLRAVDAALSGEVDAIATAPINKLAFAQAGLEWKGHTDLLAHLCGADHVAMMFHSPQLKVVLLTVHVPLQQVASLLTPQLLDRTIALTERCDVELWRRLSAARARRSEPARW